MPTTAEKATEIRKRAAAETERIRSNKDLSPAGLQRQLARVTQDMNNKLRDLRVAEQKELEDRRETLVRRLVRNPNARDAASASSYRDAQDRADAVKTGDQAARMYQRAVRSGDDLLARALAFRAAERGSFGGAGWADILDDWAGNEPGARDALDELQQIAQADSTRGRWARQLATTSLGTPSELRGVANVGRLAAQADDGGDAA